MFSIYTDYSGGTDYTAADYIRNSFANTQNGILYTYGPSRDEDDESGTIFCYRMNWTEADRDALISELEAFCQGQGTLFVKDDGLYEGEVHTRCRRYLRLTELEAPHMVIQGEAFHLAAVALLNRFAGEPRQIWPRDGASSLELQQVNLYDLGESRAVALDDKDAMGVVISIDGVDLCTLLSPSRPKEYGHLNAKILSNTLNDEHGVIACCGDCGWPGCWDAMVEIETREDAVFWKVTPHGAERPPLRFRFDRAAYDRATEGFCHE